MKNALFVLSLMSVVASPALARSYQFVFEKEMPLAACEAEMTNVASSRGLTLQEWQTNDYYLLEQGEHVGNAYYSSGTCYIYIE